MDNDKDRDDWLAGLSGKRPAHGAHDEAATLRKVLLRQQQETAAQAAEPGPEAEVSELTQQRILKSLREEELKSSGRPARADRRVWVAAASFMLVALATTLIWQPWQSSIEITRGVVGGLKITNPAPDAEAPRVVAELQLLGLSATQQSDNDRVRLEVMVGTAQLPRFSEWMEGRGGSARAAGLYEIIIERGP